MKPTAAQHEPEPFVRAAPIREGTETLYGCLSGLAKVRDDLTKPLGIKWEALKGAQC